jgi:hypothetical protein
MSGVLFMMDCLAEYWSVNGTYYLDATGEAGVGWPGGEAACILSAQGVRSCQRGMNSEAAKWCACCSMTPPATLHIPACLPDCLPAAPRIINMEIENLTPRGSATSGKITVRCMVKQATLLAECWCCRSL